jgi:5-(carboxyamino)imidazole ribonucleotide mutase
MGSDSDLPVMGQAAEALAELGVPYEVRVVSAHRTPLDMIEYGRTAAERGLRVIVAGAGGAAHLPGMLASVTALPVIGVPVRTAALSGLDSLLSIVQMPRGVPVATVAIDGARNAGLLAARILALGDAGLGERVIALQRAQEAAAREADGRLRGEAGSPPP